MSQFIVIVGLSLDPAPLSTTFGMGSLKGKQI